MICLSLSFAIFQVRPIATGKHVLDTGGEANLTHKILEVTQIDLKKDFFPLWNPWFGPGGSHTTILAFIPWDFRYFLEEYWTSNTFVFGLDLFLCCLAYCSAFFYFGFKTIYDQILVLLSFLFYLNTEFLRFFFGYFVQNSVYIATPLVFLLIYLFEKTEIKKNVFVPCLSLLLWFGSEGSKIELWFFQLPIVILLWVTVCKICLKTSLLNGFKSYLLSFGIFLGLVGWKIYILLPQIWESKRVVGNHNGHFYDIVSKFFATFSESSSILVASAFCVLSFCFVLKKPKALICLGLATLGILFWRMNILREDLSKTSLLTFGSVCFSFISLMVIKKNGEAYQKRRILLLTTLLWAITSLLLQDTSIYNWGNPSFLQIPEIYRWIFVMGVLLGGMASQRIVQPLVMYLGLFTLLRDHLSVLLLEKAGFIWHVQRDSSFFLFPLCALFFFGAQTIKGFLQEKTGPGGGLLNSALGLVLLCFIAFSFVAQRNLFYLSYLTAPRKDFQAAYSIPENSRVFRMPYCYPTNVWAPLEGFERKVREISIYGSTISSFARLAVEANPREPGSGCHLNYLWFPNNIQRIYGFPFDERLKNYLNIISPMLDLTKRGKLSEIAPEFLILNEDPKDSQFEFARTLAEVGDERVLLFKNKQFEEPPFATCKAHPGVIKEKSTETTYFSEPKLKNKYWIRLVAEEKADITIRQTFSNLWNYKVNGNNIRAKVDPSGFVILPCFEGQNLVEAEYAKWLKPIFLAGLTILFLNVTFLGFLLAFNRRC